MEQAAHDFGASSAAASTAWRLSGPLHPVTCADGDANATANATANANATVQSDEVSTEPAVCDSKVAQFVFSNIRTGVGAMVQFIREFERYLDKSRQHYSDMKNRSQDWDHIIQRFNAADLSLQETGSSLCIGDNRFLPNMDKVDADVQRQLVMSYFNANKSLFEKLHEDIEVEHPRFIKVETLSADSKAIINFTKISRNLQKAEEILTSYQKKIDRYSSDCKQAAEGSSSNSNNSSSSMQKQDTLRARHHNTVEFSIFLAFKLVKYDLVEYFLYIRDCISGYHELWTVLNFREVYQTLYEVVVYFEYCSTILGELQRKKHNVESAADDKRQKRDVSTRYTTKQLMEQYNERNKQFAACMKRLASFTLQVQQKKSFFSIKREAFLAKLDKNVVIKENKVRLNFINMLYQQQPMYETVNILVLNYHIRYLRLIDKFVQENKNCTFFKTNLLPVQKRKQQYSSENRFETLIRLIEAKIKKNIVKLHGIDCEMTALIEDADLQVLAGDKFGILRKLPALMTRLVKVLNDSFEYICSLIPLFPFGNNSASPAYNMLVFAPPPPLPATTIANVSATSATSATVAAPAPAPARQQSHRMLRSTYGNSSRRLNKHRMRHHAHLQNRQYFYHLYNRSPKSEYPESFLSTSWFIGQEHKKKLNDLILNSLHRYAKFLNSLDSIDMFADAEITLDCNVNAKATVDGDLYVDDVKSRAGKDRSNDDIKLPDLKRRKLHNRLEFRSPAPSESLSIVSSPTSSLKINSHAWEKAHFANCTNPVAAFFALFRDLDKQYQEFVHSVREEEENPQELLNFIIL